MAQGDRPDQFHYAYIAGISERRDEAAKAAAGHAGQGSLGDIALARGLIMSTTIQRSGSGFNPTDTFSVKFDSRAVIDNVTIVNNYNHKERLMMSMQEAEMLADFIYQAKAAYRRYLDYQRHPAEPFADIDAE